MRRRVYLDASALVKLIARERESEALTEYLGVDSAIATSVIAAVEVPRAARAAERSDRVTELATRLIESCDLVELDAITRSLAARAEPDRLRSLDAIHLASALAIRDVLDAFVSYDQRLGDAARAAGLAVVSPER